MVETRAMRMRRARTTTWADLEHVEGIFFEILSRLPLRSLRLFKRVNKYWYRSITNSLFVKMQLSISREKPCYITCPDMDIPMVLYSMKQGSFRRFRLNTIDPAERKQGESINMVSSFNGLICCVNERHRHRPVPTDYHDLQIWIVNPCTGETLLLPQGRPSFKFTPSIGVAYGSTDYKVFRIFCAGKKVPEERVVSGYAFNQGQMVPLYRYTRAFECEVYSSITGVWENIGPLPCLPILHLTPFRCHVFVGGRVYWLSSLDYEDAILCVDFEGRFEVIQFPPYEGNPKGEDRITEGTYLFILQGRLALVILHREHMELWMLKGSGQNGSWILVCQGTTPGGDNDMVLAMTSIKDQIICVTEEKWCYYDMATRKWKYGRTNHAGFVHNPTVYPFTESFLPCAGML